MAAWSRSQSMAQSWISARKMLTVPIVPAPAVAPELPIVSIEPVARSDMAVALNEMHDRLLHLCSCLLLSAPRTNIKGRRNGGCKYYKHLLSMKAIGRIGDITARDLRSPRRGRGYARLPYGQSSEESRGHLRGGI